MRAAPGSSLVPPTRRARWALAAATIALGALGPAVFVGSARADDDTSAMFAAAVRSLHDGRAGDAIAGFEALADRGVVDPVASYDRGLAYAMRVRIGAELPGDLGRAAHGFDEARDLSGDPHLIEDATAALAVVRGEVARRRLHSGDAAEVDPGRSLARTVAKLLPENTWALLAAAASAALALALFVRWLADNHRARVAGGTAAAVAGASFAIAVAMTLAARHDRLNLREAVVVAANARPSDPRGLLVRGAAPISEGARVEVVDASGAWTRVRFGSLDTWLPSGSLRALARSD